MGQYTKLMGTYAKEHEGCLHIVVEQDGYWADVFKKSEDIPNTRVAVIPVIKQHYPTEGSCFVYRHDSKMLRDVIGDKKFNVISIDGPVGTNGNPCALSRSDILEFLPNCLEDDFVIIMDDYERDEERNTSKEIRNILSKNGIEYEYGLYHGESMVNVICSKKYRYLCSL